MALDTIPTGEELTERYREWAHKCVFHAMLNKETIKDAEEYIGTIAKIVDMVIDGAMSIATEIEVDEMKERIQELLNL